MYAEKRRLLSAWLPAGDTLSPACVRLAFVICARKGQRREPDRRGGVREDIERICKHTGNSLTDAYPRTHAESRTDARRGFLTRDENRAPASPGQERRGQRGRIARTHEQQHLVRANTHTHCAAH